MRESAQSVKILHKFALKTLASFQKLKGNQRCETFWLDRPFNYQGHSVRSPVAHLDEPIYPAQATLPQESDQLRLNRHSALNATKATAPGAQLLTLTSPSTLHRPRCLRSQISSGYIAIRLKRHEGHSARSQVAHLDEPIYPAQATLPQELDQLRLHRHSA